MTIRRQTIVSSAIVLLGIFGAVGPGWSQLPPSSGDTVVASVGGIAITEQELSSKIQPQLQQLRNQEYDLKQSALESLINQKLVEAEAARRGISAEDLLKQEVDDKVSEPTGSDIQAFYDAHKAQINAPFDAVKDQVRDALKQSEIEQRRKDFYQSLRDKGNVVVLLKPPRFQIAADPQRLRGNPNAPVKIIEFADFECPYCQKAYPTMRELLAKYPDKVSLGYRDFPLSDIHPDAEIAAEASRCAEEQGHFWEYHDLLFEYPNQLSKEVLEEHAAVLGLDTKRFQTCLESSRYKAAIQADFEEGARAGIEGTPAFFINGIFLSGAQPASAFEKTIESELAAAAH